ncbi:MAG: hypothetical protein GKS06_12610 [Acidobacteria bacterium]|nr:hypothetical protein [Acidobacteriota bacterium]
MSLVRSRRLWAVVACCVVCLCAPSSAPAKQPITRALWVWGEASPATATWAAREDFDTLLLEIPGVRIGATSTAKVIRAARAGSMKVWALSGHPDWARGTAAVRKWTRRVRRTKGLSGIVLDIEPYLLDQWDTARRRTIENYLRSLRAAKRAAGPLPVMAAVPFWFDHDTYRDRDGTLAEKIAGIVDEVAVMAYRDRALGSDSIVTLSRGEVDISSRLGKAALITVQTAPDSLDKLTFHEEGVAELQKALDATIAAFESQPGFRGIAVHHYSAYRRFLDNRSAHPWPNS